MKTLKDEFKEMLEPLLTIHYMDNDTSAPSLDDIAEKCTQMVRDKFKQ